MQFEPSRPVCNHILTLLHDQAGQDMIEYALVAALVGLAAVASMKGLAAATANAFNSVSTSISTNI